MELSKLSKVELLRLQASATNELRRRGVVKTQNNPIGDYTEWLVAKALCLELKANSQAGYDGSDSKGTKYQIKGRRITPDNKTKQLSAIRNYEQKNFDILIAVIYDEGFEIISASQIPHNVIADYARYTAHTNSHTLILRDKILNDKRVMNIKPQITKYHN